MFLCMCFLPCPKHTYFPRHFQEASPRRVSNPLRAPQCNTHTSISSFAVTVGHNHRPVAEDPNDPGTDEEDKMSEPPDPDGGAYFAGPCGSYIRRELNSPVPSGIKRDHRGNMRVGMGLRTFPVEAFDPAPLLGRRSGDRSGGAT